MSTKVYGYDGDGYFTGEVEAQASPREPGKFLLPANATTTEPCECETGQIQQYVNGSWKCVDNNKGAIVYHKETGSKVVYNQLGPISAIYTLEECPDSTLYFWKDGKWTLDTDKLFLKMKGERDYKLYVSDWTQLPDAPLTDEQKQAWALYRQELRNYTIDWTADKQLPKEPS